MAGADEGRSGLDPAIERIGRDAAIERSGLEATIEHCELALACLDAAGLFGDGASLSLALDNLRRRRDDMIASEASGRPSAATQGQR